MGRIPTGKIPDQALQHMRTRHIKIMHLLLAGYTAAEISQAMKISQSRLSVIRNSPIFRKRLHDEQARINEGILKEETGLQTRIGRMGIKALDYLEGAIDPLDPLYADIPAKEKRLIAQHLTEMADLIPGKGSDRIRALNARSRSLGDAGASFLRGVLEEAAEKIEQKKNRNEAIPVTAKAV